MKRYIGFTLSLVLCVMIGNAQDAGSQRTNPRVTKGYYAIGDNNTKLATPVQGSVGSDQTPVVQKGYYGLKQNRNKLKSKSVTVNTAGAPVVTKGYYSIGNNAQKLQSSRQQ